MQSVILAVAAVAAFIGALTDIQKREIADWISFSLLVFGIGAAALSSVVSGTLEPIAFSITGLAVFFLVGWFMFRMGWWGGGDSKLLIAFGACFGLPFSLVFPYVEAEGFMVSFLSNFLITSPVYTLAWFVFLISTRRERFRDALAERLVDRRKRFFLGAGTGFSILAASVIVPNLIAKYLLSMTGLILLLYFCIIPASRAVEKIMLRKVCPYKLTEGELIAEEVFVKDRVIAGPADLGASKEQIIELRDLHDRRRIRDVLIKVGIPLIPNFFVTMAVTYFFGNVLKVILDEFVLILVQL